MLGDKRLGLRRSYIPCWGSQLYPVGNGKRLKGVNQKSAKVRTGGDPWAALRTLPWQWEGARDALAGTTEGTY